MAAKNVVAKDWMLTANYDGTLDSRYPNGDKPSGPVIVPPILGVPTMGSTTASVPFAPGENYTYLIPQYRLEGDTDWTSLDSVTDSPLEFTSLLPESDYVFRALPDGEESKASNVVDGTTTVSGTDFSQIWRYTDFSDGTLGANVTTVMDWVGSGSALNSVISNEQAFSGQYVAKNTILAGEENFNRIGFTANWSGSESLGPGDEIWERIALYFPSGWSFDAGPNGALKAFRNYGRTAASDYDLPNGAVDIQIKTASPHDWRCLHENQGIGWQNDITGGEGVVEFDVWQVFEAYLRIDTVPASSGGNALLRLYKDGVLVAEVDNIYTLGAATDRINNWLMFTYWNGANGSTIPPAQTFYWAAPAIAIKRAANPGVGVAARDDTPYMARDASGNPYIGV